MKQVKLTTPILVIYFEFGDVPQDIIHSNNLVFLNREKLFIYLFTYLFDHDGELIGVLGRIY